MFGNLNQSTAAFRSHVALHKDRGVIALPSVITYTPDEFKRNYQLALDAQPQLQTDPNSGIPVFLTTMIDPSIYKVLFAPNKAAEIIGEVKKGTWLDVTAMFPTVEHSGETSAYGDYNENGTTTVNTNFPNRQSFLFQIIKQYGEHELELAGLARINWVSELDGAAATILNKYSNLTYFFGVGGLENYGLINDPNMSAPLTPSTKAWGGVGWINDGVIVATANEIYADIQSMFLQLVAQSQGIIDKDTKMCLAMSPESAVALTATNSYGVNVEDLLKKNFPNIKVDTAPQYGELTASNPQGLAAGNLAQLIADSVDGQKTGFCAYNEKMRAHKIIPMLSSYKQKVTAGTWGTVIRQPFAISAMQGI